MIILLLSIFICCYATPIYPMSKEATFDDESFLTLCLEGNLEAIESLGNLNVNYNCSIKHSTPLANALIAYEESLQKPDISVRIACKKLIFFLIAHNANLHAPNASAVGRHITPFHTICMKRFIDILAEIIKSNPRYLSYSSEYDEPNNFFETKDYRGMNVLMLAIEKNQFEVVLLLLSSIPHKQLKRIIELQDNTGYTLMSWLYFLLPNKPMEGETKSITKENYDQIHGLGCHLASIGSDLLRLNIVQKITKNVNFENDLKTIQALFKAVETDNDEFIKQNQGAVELCDRYNLCNADGNPLLYVALKHAAYKTIELLLKFCSELITQQNRFSQNVCEFCIGKSLHGAEMFKFLVKLAFEKNAKPSTQSSTSAILSTSDAPVAQ